MLPTATPGEVLGFVAEALGFAVLGLLGIIILSWVYDAVERGTTQPLPKWHNPKKKC